MTTAFGIDHVKFGLTPMKYNEKTADPKKMWVPASWEDTVLHVRNPLLPPTILLPEIGSEVSNLNPKIKIQHSMSLDEFRHEINYGTGQYGGMDSGGKEAVGELIPLQGYYVHFVTYERGLSSGRPQYLRIPSYPEFIYDEYGGLIGTAPPIQDGDVEFTIYRVPMDNEEDGVDSAHPDNVSGWDKLFEGPVPTNFIVEIPYWKMFRNGWDYTVVHVKPKTRTDICMGSVVRDQNIEDRQRWYRYGFNTASARTEWHIADITATNSIPNIGAVMTSGHQHDVTYYYELSLDNGSSWTQVAQLDKMNGGGYLVGGESIEGPEKRIVYANPTSDAFTWTFDEVTEIFDIEYDISHLIASGTETYQAKIRVRGKDDNGTYSEGWWARSDNYSPYGTMSGVFTIIKHIPPEAPINLKISDTGIIDKNIGNRFSWKYIQNSMNNRQGRALIQWRKQGDTPWNDIPINNMNTFYDVPPDTFPLGTIEWQVKTWNYVDMEGPFSAISTFIAKDTPTGPTILTPIGLVEEPSPPVSWEHNYIQTSYIINALDLSDTVLWTSGEVKSESLTSKIGKYLANLTTFKIQIQVKTNEGLWSAFTTQLFNTDYQFPAPAIVTVSGDKGFITVAYDNPQPTGQQPTVARNEVYKMIDNVWTKISDASPHSFNDYASANNVTNYYFVRSIASNGAYTDSDVKSAKVKVQGVVLYLVNDPEGTLHQFRVDGHGRSKNWSIESSLMKFKGRKYPAIEVGTMEEDVIDFTLIIEDEEEKQALDHIIYSGHICCYRDGRGRMAHGIFTEYPETDERWGGYTVNLSLTKIDYLEGSIIEDEDDGILNVVVDGGEF